MCGDCFRYLCFNCMAVVPESESEIIFGHADVLYRAVVTRE